MSLTPSDLRPGQRVRITRRYDAHDCVEVWEGAVEETRANTIKIRGLGYTITGFCDGYTQTIEVIE